MAIILALLVTQCTSRTTKSENENKWNPAFSIIRTIITGSR